jgi:hypothetical protein
VDADVEQWFLFCRRSRLRPEETGCGLQGVDTPPEFVRAMTRLA